MAQADSLRQLLKMTILPLKSVCKQMELPLLTRFCFIISVSRLVKNNKISNVVQTKPSDIIFYQMVQFSLVWIKLFYRIIGCKYRLYFGV